MIFPSYRRNLIKPRRGETNGCGRYDAKCERKTRGSYGLADPDTRGLHRTILLFATERSLKSALRLQVAYRTHTALRAGVPSRLSGGTCCAKIFFCSDVKTARARTADCARGAHACAPLENCSRKMGEGRTMPTGGKASRRTRDRNPHEQHDVRTYVYIVYVNYLRNNLLA